MKSGSVFLRFCVTGGINLHFSAKRQKDLSTETISGVTFTLE